MRLLQTETLELHEFPDRSLPRYGILSHTWTDHEVTYQDMRGPSRPKHLRGYAKIKYVCFQAHKDGLHYVWVDTCCIDKSSSAELQEAINSMYRWYSQAAECYVYLEDIPGDCPDLNDKDRGRDGARKVYYGWHEKFKASRWFTRGWTLQELIGPRRVVFFGQAWNYLGTKDSLLELLCAATSIDASVLDHASNVSSASVAKRMSWAAHRQTSRAEDEAYCLLGIFDVNMPMLYGEGLKAFIRLQEEIIKTTTDHSIFAWDLSNAGREAKGRLLATAPADFASCRDIVQWGKSRAFEMTNRGFRGSLRNLAYETNYDEHCAILNCRYANDLSGALAIRLRKYVGTEEYYALVGEVPPQPSFAPVSKVRANSRLTFVDEKTMATANPTMMQIGRDFEPESSTLKFWVPLSNHSFRILQAYPEGLWDAYDGILHAPDNRRVRAGIVVESSTGVRFNVAFGIDLVRSKTGDAYKSKSLPGVWAVRWKDALFLKGFCEGFKPCEHTNAVCYESGCSLMPTEAIVFEHPIPYRLRCQITQIRIMKDTVFVVAIDIDKIFELEAVEQPAEMDAVETERPAHSALTLHETLTSRIAGLIVERVQQRQRFVWSVVPSLEKLLKGSKLQARVRVWLELPSNLQVVNWSANLTRTADKGVLVWTMSGQDILTEGVILRSSKGKEILLVFASASVWTVLAWEYHAANATNSLRDVCRRLHGCVASIDPCGYVSHDAPIVPPTSAFVYLPGDQTLFSTIITVAETEDTVSCVINVSLKTAGPHEFRSLCSSGSPLLTQSGQIPSMHATNATRQNPATVDLSIGPAFFQQRFGYQ